MKQLQNDRAIGVEHDKQTHHFQMDAYKHACIHMGILSMEKISIFTNILEHAHLNSQTYIHTYIYILASLMYTCACGNSYIWKKSNV